MPIHWAMMPPVNTFLRVGSGDQRATDGEIMAMYHDQSFGIKSEELVANTSLADLNSQSLITYRNHLNFYNSGFPYNSLEDEAFCKKIGICSSTTGELSYGSLLMFGKQDSIRAAMPNFWVDYIEIPGISVATARPRYTFRMQEQENIWEYYKVIIQRLRLYADNPYTTTRFGVSPEDDSQLYALREGLINFLAHSDWFSPMHPTIRVFMDRIEFQNPGGFIVPVNRVLEEAISLPRNLCYSNMQPQYNSLNAFRWSDMEAKVRSWNRDSFRDTLYVVKGGTIDGRDNVFDFLTHDDYGVLIPKYFFMAILCVKNGKYKALGFWIEHKPSYSQAEQKSIKQYAISIDELEQRTGIDFFCNLDDEIEEATEKATDVSAWSF